MQCPMGGWRGSPLALLGPSYLPLSTLGALQFPAVQCSAGMNSRRKGAFGDDALALHLCPSLPHPCTTRHALDPRAAYCALHGMHIRSTYIQAPLLPLITNKHLHHLRHRPRRPLPVMKERERTGSSSSQYHSSAKPIRRSPAT